MKWHVMKIKERLEELTGSGITEFKIGDIDFGKKARPSFIEIIQTLEGGIEVVKKADSSGHQEWLEFAVESPRYRFLVDRLGEDAAVSLCRQNIRQEEDGWYASLKAETCLLIDFDNRVTYEFLMPSREYFK